MHAHDGKPSLFKTTQKARAGGRNRQRCDGDENGVASVRADFSKCLWGIPHSASSYESLWPGMPLNTALVWRI